MNPSGGSYTHGTAGTDQDPKVYLFNRDCVNFDKDLFRYLQNYQSTSDRFKSSIFKTKTIKQDPTTKLYDQEPIIEEVVHKKKVVKKKKKKVVPVEAEEEPLIQERSKSAIRRRLTNTLRKRTIRKSS